MRRALIRRSLALALAAAAAIAAPAAWAVQVPVSATRSGNSALITFSWSEPVSHAEEVADGRLTVRFSQPIEGAFSRLVNQIGDFISDARPGADGQSVSFGLKVPVEVFGYYTGTAVTVELLRTGEPAAQPAAAPAPQRAAETAAAPAPAQSAPPAPADAPRVGVRVGVHDDYTRVVFDFTQNVPYSVSSADGVVRIRFSEAAAIDVGPLNGNARLLGGARSGVSGGETEVVLAVPPSSTVRDFLSGPKVVLDVRRPADGAAPVALPPVETAAAPAPATTQAADVPPPPPEIPAPATAPAPAETALAPAPPAQPTAPVESAPMPATLAGERAQDNAQAAAESSVAQAGAPRALTPNGAPPEASPVDQELSPRAQPPSGSTPATPAKATAYPGQDQLAFRFDFEDPVAAATFRRGGAIWIVFDKPMTVDTAALQTQAGEGAFEILQLPNNDATVLRIRTSQRYNPAVKRDGLAWIIDFAPRQMAPQTALEVNAQPNSPVGARIFVPVPEPGRPIPVTDPNIGDNFVVVPVIPLGQAVGRNFTFPQFNIPVAAQGVVINPTIDDLRVRALRQGVEISSSGVRLAISNVSAEAAANAQLASSRPMVRALEDLEKLFAPTNEFRVARRRAESAVSKATNREKNAARMDLAKFFFANAYAPETLGVLRVAQEAVPLLENDPSFRVMRGGANFLLGRYDEALTDFTHESLTGNDEGRLWAAATTAMLGDRIGSARDLRFTGSIARDYPRALKMPLGILIAEVAAETGDGQGAKLFLEALNLENPTPAEQAMLKFAEGKLKELDGDYETAIALWEDVIESDHRPSRARARVARTEMLLQLRRITQREAIEEYEKLRFAWRGDKREFQNLRRLGSLYLDEGYYRDGLSTLKEAATHFRDYPEAPEVTKQMSDTFNGLFLGEDSNALDPVKAIAIYNEFKELTPAGPRGDAMIRNLADKLVEVDLLDRAASLLTAQVQFRLQGEEKARVGARLALIYTLAREYERAAEVLEGTGGPGLPEPLVAQRRHLLARALMGQERQNDALALLAEDDSEQADLLRTEIFWNAGNWLEAAKSLRLLVRHTGAKAGEPLNDIQAARIINYAVALTNSGGERAIGQLVRDFSPAMAQTKYAEAFNLVTAPSTVGVLAPGAVAAKVQEAETFLAAYRDKLKSGVPLSSIN